MEVKTFYHRGHRGHGEEPRIDTDNTDFGEADNCAGLQSTRVIGHIFWPSFTARSRNRIDNCVSSLQALCVIRLMYKICLLTTLLFYAILKLDLTGAAPADQHPGKKSLVVGETRNGLHPCGQWPTVWVTSYRGLR
jgi:hypothetical protein